MIARLLLLSLALSFVMSPAIVWAERVWDSEIKRYLTEQEMSMAEVFLSEEEAFKLMFPKSERIKKELLRVPADKMLSTCWLFCYCLGLWAVPMLLGSTTDARDELIGAFGSLLLGHTNAQSLPKSS